MPTTIAIDASRANIKKRTGVEVYSLQIILALAKQNKAHFNYKLFLPPGPIIHELQNLPTNFSLITVDPPKWWETSRQILPLPPLWTHISLANTLKKSSFDILYFPGHVIPISYHHPKIILTIHDVAFKKIPEDYSLKERLLNNFFTHKDLKKAKKIITVSQTSKKDIKQIYNIQENKIETIYPGYDQKRFYPHSQTDIKKTIKKYDISKDYFIFIGRLVKNKNIPTLLRAYQELYQNFPQKEKIPQLVIGGHGHLLPKLQKIAKNYKINSLVKWLGYVPSKDLGPLLSGAKAYIQPSTYEGFGIPIIEAMACKTTIISSTGGSLAEVVGKSGYLFSPYDNHKLFKNMQEVLHNQTQNILYKEKATQKITSYQWDKAAQKLITIFTSI